MSEINDWDKVAANNNDAPPNGWPENMNYSEVNNAAREGMSAHARLYADMNGTLATAGAANAYTLTSNRALSAYASGLGFIFKANHTNTGAATINVSGLGAKDLKNVDGSALSTDHIESIGEVNPEKMGRYTPGTGIPIVNEDLLIKSKKNGDIFIVLPWHFKENFLNNPKYRGLTLVFPLPNIEIKRDV